MRFVVNHADNRIVDATLEETHALRPVIRAVLWRYGCPQREIEDIAQQVEIVAWRALNEGASPRRQIQISWTSVQRRTR